MKALFVDDDPDLAEQGKLFLEKEGDRLNVEATTSAREALDTLEDGGFDAVISDYRMPEMDGLEFLRVLREERDSDIPFIIFTGKGREKVAMEALNLGANRYVRKGGDPASQYGVLADAIVREVGHKRAEERSREMYSLRSAIREINQTIAQRSDLDEILQTSAESLAEAREYVDVCIILVGEGEKITHAAHSGERNEERLPLIRGGELPRCADEVLESESPNLRAEQGDYCADCHLRSYCADLKTFAVPVFSEGSATGSLIVRLEKDRELKEEGLDLLKEVAGDLGFAREKIRAEERVEFESGLLRSLLNHIPVSVYFKDREARFIRVSRSKVEHLGGDEESIIGKTDFDFYPEAQAQEMYEDDERVMEEEKTIANKVEKITRPGGEERWVSATKVPRYDEEGRVVGVLGISRDITDLMETRERLDERRAELQSLIRGSEDSIYVVDENCRYLLANSELLSRLDRERGEVIGNKFHDFHTEEEAMKFEEKVSEVVERGEPLQHEHGWKEPERWFLRTFSPIKDSKTGKVKSVSVISKDITGRKKAREKLRESRREYKTLFDGTLDGIAVIDEETMRIVRANRAALEIFGYDSMEEVGGASPLDFVHPEDKERVRLIIRRNMFEKDLQEINEFRIITKNGERKWLSAVGTRIEYPEKEAGLISFRDITERKEAEKRFKKLFNASPDPTYLIDRNGVFQEVNQAGVDILGYEREEMLGKSISEAPFFPPGTREKIAENFKKRLSGEKIPPYQIEAETKNGESLIGEVNSTLLKEKGEPAGVIGVARNVTERKEAEKREELLHSLLRHNVKNKAQTARGFIKLSRDCHLPEKAEGYMDKADSSIQDCMDLVEKVRTLRKVGERKVEEVALDPAIDTAVSDNEDRASEGGIEILHEGSGCKVRGGPLLKQLFSNLIGNSILHSGCDRIEISSREMEKGIGVTVEDDGKGIPDGEKDRVLERGFKKGESAGSGLGGYLARRIAESYGGGIEIRDSELGGARFDIHLEEA